MADEATPAKCTNTYGPESGPHDGPAEWAAILRSPSTGKELTRDEPLCRAHALYERAWRQAVGSIAEVTVERLTSPVPEG